MQMIVYTKCKDSFLNNFNLILCCWEGNCDCQFYGNTFRTTQYYVYYILKHKPSTVFIAQLKKAICKLPKRASEKQMCFKY